jgi:hypothetical protein
MGLMFWVLLTRAKMTAVRMAVMLMHVVAERATQIRAKSTLTRGSGKSYTYVRKVLTLARADHAHTTVHHGLACAGSVGLSGMVGKVNPPFGG